MKIARFVLIAGLALFGLSVYAANLIPFPPGMKNEVCTNSKVASVSYQKFNDPLPYGIYLCLNLPNIYAGELIIVQGCVSVYTQDTGEEGFVNVYLGGLYCYKNSIYPYGDPPYNKVVGPLLILQKIKKAAVSEQLLQSKAHEYESIIKTGNN